MKLEIHCNACSRVVGVPIVAIQRDDKEYQYICAMGFGDYDFVSRIDGENKRFLCEKCVDKVGLRNGKNQSA